MSGFARVWLCGLFFVAGIFSCVVAQTFPVREIVNNGEPGRRINIVFLSEGYTMGEITEFYSDVMSATGDLFNEPPYKEYAMYFNVYAIEVPSIESGTDHPNTASDCPDGLPTVYKNTYFSSTFDYAGIHRLLVILDTQAARSVLTDNFPEWDIVFIVVHSDWYGGSGGEYATFSTHSAASEVAIHEVGHSFALLADEYEYGGLTPYEAPNATAETRRDHIRWTNWIDDLTPVPTPETEEYGNVVGLFEGAVYNPIGWYRPKLECKMRALGVPFCEVCKEQTILSVYDLVTTVESRHPSQDIVIMYEREIKEFSVAPMEPMPNTIHTSWYVDDSPVAEGTTSYWFDAADRGVGSFELSASIRDSTGMVRTDPSERLRTDIVWQVVVDTVVTAIGDDAVARWQPGVRLYQNTPNPFNPTTTIRYHLPLETPVSLVVFGPRGERIKTLVEGVQPAGEKAVVWDGRNDAGTPVSSGIYLYRLEAGPVLRVKKMLLIK